MKLGVKHIIFYSLLAVLLSACAVGKKYNRQNIDIPDHYRQQSVLTGDTLVLPWKTFFRDPKLIKLVEQAMEKNNDVSIAIMNLEQLDLSYKQAKLGLLPTLDFNAGASRTYQSKNSLNGSLSEQFTGKTFLDDFNATLSLSWEVDIWGKAKMQKEAAKASYFMQKENLSALKSRIVVQVAQAYYNLITLDEQLKVAQQNIELSNSTLQMIRLQYQSAQVNALAVEQAEAQKKTAELLVPLAKQQIEVQENALSILCGKFPDQVERAKSINEYQLASVFPSGVPAQLLSRRPDVKAAEYAVIVANANAGLSKATMYPAISLSPSIGANSFEFSNWFDLPGSIVKSFAGNIVQPIFRKKALRTAYEINVIEQQKMAQQFKQSVMNAVGEVSDAMVKAKYADERLKLVEEKKAALEKANNYATLLYKSGMANYLEVIVAQNNKLQNELEALNIHLEKLNAITDLYRALGGGYE